MNCPPPISAQTTGHRATSHHPGWRQATGLFQATCAQCKRGSGWAWLVGRVWISHL